MTPDIVLLIIFGLPIALILLLRVNGSLAFLSACLGSVLLKFVGSEAVNLTNLFLPSLTGRNLELAVLLLPVVLTLLFLRKTVRGGSQIVNILPAIGTGLLIAILVVPLLPPDFARQAMASASWHKLEQFQALVVGASALIVLLFMWLKRGKLRPAPKESKKHHG